MLQAVCGLITDKVAATNGLGFYLKCQLYVRLVHMPVIIAKHHVEKYWDSARQPEGEAKSHSCTGTWFTTKYRRMVPIWPPNTHRR